MSIITQLQITGWAGTIIEACDSMIEESPGPQSNAIMACLRTENIHQRILIIRGHRVILDADLAELYGVPTKVFNQAVHRNAERFPDDFMFQLSREEVDLIRSQIVTLKAERGKHRKYLPYAFTEQGVAMLSGVLRGHRAVQVNIAIRRQIGF